jgi:hypothetical protein
MNDLIWGNMKTKEVIIEQQKDFIDTNYRSFLINIFKNL